MSLLRNHRSQEKAGLFVATSIFGLSSTPFDAERLRTLEARIAQNFPWIQNIQGIESRFKLPHKRDFVRVPRD